MLSKSRQNERLMEHLLHTVNRFIQEPTRRRKPEPSRTRKRVFFQIPATIKCGSVRIDNMDRVPPEAVKDPPNLVRTGSFSLDRLLSHIDPGPAEESEAFVRFIYEQRRTDVSTERNDKIGR